MVLDEWFRTLVLPKLEKFIAEEDPGADAIYETKCDEFLDILKTVLHGRIYNSGKVEFAAALLEIVIGNENLEIHSKIQECFQKLNAHDNKELVSITYNDGNDLVTCKYNAAESQD
jgi:hypothetical protein